MSKLLDAMRYKEDGASFMIIKVEKESLHSLYLKDRLGLEELAIALYQDYVNATPATKHRVINSARELTLYYNDKKTKDNRVFVTLVSIPKEIHKAFHKETDTYRFDLSCLIDVLIKNRLLNINERIVKETPTIPATAPIKECVAKAPMEEKDMNQALKRAVITVRRNKRLMSAGRIEKSRSTAITPTEELKAFSRKIGVTLRDAVSVLLVDYSNRSESEQDLIKQQASVRTGRDMNSYMSRSFDVTPDEKSVLMGLGSLKSHVLCEILEGYKNIEALDTHSLKGSVPFGSPGGTTVEKEEASVKRFSNEKEMLETLQGNLEVYRSQKIRMKSGELPFEKTSITIPTDDIKEFSQLYDVRMSDICGALSLDLVSRSKEDRIELLTKASSTVIGQHYGTNTRSFVVSKECAVVINSLGHYKSRVFNEMLKEYVTASGVCEDASEAIENDLKPGYITNVPTGDSNVSTQPNFTWVDTRDSPVNHFLNTWIVTDPMGSEEDINERAGGDPENRYKRNDIEDHHPKGGPEAVTSVDDYSKGFADGYEKARLDIMNQLRGMKP